MTERDTEIEFDFFEEPATREAARPERSSRRTGGPRGPRKPVGPQSGLTPLLRLVGLISLAILVVVGFVFWVSSCRGEAKSNRYQSYMADISQVAEESENLGTQLATTLTRPEVRQAQLISTLKGLAQQQVQLVLTARRIDPPGPLRPQQNQLVESLQFRVSGLNGLADAFKTPSRDETQAGELLAAQARRLVASDVIWDDLFKDPAKEELDSQGVQGVRVPDSNFIQNPDLTTSRSMGTVWQRTRAAGTGGTVTRPGSHGHGLTSVKVVGGSNLSSTELNKIVATTDLAFEVTFENSGDSTETGVEVQLTIQKETEPLVRTQRVDLTEPNETATVTFRDVGNVPFVQRTTLQISVEPVPSESNKANNSAEYPVIFSYPGG